MNVGPVTFLPWFLEGYFSQQWMLHAERRKCHLSNTIEKGCVVTTRSYIDGLKDLCCGLLCICISDRSGSLIRAVIRFVMCKYRVLSSVYLLSWMMTSHSCNPPTTERPMWYTSVSGEYTSLWTPQAFWQCSQTRRSASSAFVQRSVRNCLVWAAVAYARPPIVGYECFVWAKGLVITTKPQQCKL